MRYKDLMQEHELRKFNWLPVAGILAVAVFLRFYRLSHQSLWVDEILSYKVFTSAAGVPFWKKLLYDVHGPLYSLIMHVWSAVSTSDFWLRTPSAIAGACAVYALFRWFAAIGRRDLALPAALFMALSPFHLYYSQELRFYALLSVLVLVTLIAFERYRAAPTARRGIALGVTFALACLAHFSAVFLGAAFLVYLAFTGRLRGKHLRYGMLAAAIVIVAIAPWIYREISNLRHIRVVGITALPVEERLRGELTLSRWSYPYALYAFSVGYSFGPGLRELHSVTSAGALMAKHAAAFVAAGVVFGGLLVSGIIRSARDGRLGLFLSVIVVATVSVTAITAFNVKVFNVRYLMCAFPLYLALVVYGLPSGGWARLLAGAAVCAVMLVSDLNYYIDPDYAREDVRSAAATVMRNEAEGDLIIAPAVEEVFAHYYSGSNRVEYIEPADLGVEGLDGAIDASFLAHSRIWYVRSRSWDKDPEGLMLRVLPEKGALADSWAFAGVDLELYAARTHPAPGH
jgi:mannosyltransferase